MTLDFLACGPERGPMVLLAHGAGAAMDTPFMTTVAEGLAAAGARVLRFEFPYMAERRRSGRRKPPDREAVLLDTWRAAVAQCGVAPHEVVIGGKSMGGRMASLVADSLGVKALGCLGFPFHAPGKIPGKRIAHLAALVTPTLIVQGERDSMGTRAEVADYALSPAVRLVWLPDGNHSFEPRKSAGVTLEQNMRAAVAAMAELV